MDQNTELLLARAGQPLRWEDEEKATNDIDELRKDFRCRLYAGGETGTEAVERNGPATRNAE